MCCVVRRGLLFVTDRQAHNTYKTCAERFIEIKECVSDKSLKTGFTLCIYISTDYVQCSTVIVESCLL